jgi:purine-nucleoside phosphorylase
MAAGILAQKLSHAEVIETTEKVGKTFVDFVKELIGKLD